MSHMLKINWAFLFQILAISYAVESMYYVKRVKIQCIINLLFCVVYDIIAFSNKIAVLKKTFS